jgi:hypothetical protein
VFDPIGLPVDIQRSPHSLSAKTNIDTLIFPVEVVYENIYTLVWALLSLSVCFYAPLLAASQVPALGFAAYIILVRGSEQVVYNLYINNTNIHICILRSLIFLILILFSLRYEYAFPSDLNRHSMH